MLLTHCGGNIFKRIWASVVNTIKLSSINLKVSIKITNLIIMFDMIS